MNNGYKKILLGLIFIILNLKINNFDILPDFIGFILIAHGANLIIDTDIIFKKIKNLSILLSLFKIVQLIIAFFYSYTTFPTYYSFILGIIDTVLEIQFLYLIYLICTSIYNLGKNNNCIDLMDSSNFRFIIFFFSFAITEILSPFIYNFYTNNLNLILIIFAVLNFLSFISIIFLVNNANKFIQKEIPS